MAGSESTRSLWLGRGRGAREGRTQAGWHTHARARAAGRTRDSQPVRANGGVCGGERLVTGARVELLPGGRFRPRLPVARLGRRR